jgi:hypothetical protein
MLIGIVTLEVGFAGIDVSFGSLVGVIFDSIIGHGTTSLVECLVGQVGFRFPDQQCKAFRDWGNEGLITA